MNKMPCEITDSGAINGPEDDVIIPEVEFVRHVPMQVGGLPWRIRMALNDYREDRADIDVMMLLLEEALHAIKLADENFRALSDGVDQFLARIDTIKEQAE